MKKTLSVLAVLGVVSMIAVPSANAFEWSNLNPAYWGSHCPKCKKQKDDCGCKKVKTCDPCERITEPCPTGAAAPCNPCNKVITQPAPCDACDRLQRMSK